MVLLLPSMLYTDDYRQHITLLPVQWTAQPHPDTGDVDVSGAQPWNMMKVTTIKVSVPTPRGLTHLPGSRQLSVLLAGEVVAPPGWSSLNLPRHPSG